MKLKLKISKGNTKLGGIRSFSMSSLNTCPSKTEWCAKHCYAHRQERMYPNVKRAYKINLNATSKKTFVYSMVEEIKNNNKNNIFRIHVSGDFKDVRYIYNWVSIAKQLPEITFYGYTRSWEDVNLLPHLGILNKLDNVVLFASVDDTTNKNSPKTFRIAYAGDNKPTHIKSVICPQQQEKVEHCLDCKLCFNKKINTNIYFETH